MPTRGGISASDQGAGTSGNWVSGNYYGLGDFGVLGNGTPTLNAEYAYPIVVPNACTLSKIGASLVTAGTAGAVLRIGLRLPDANGQPGALLLDAGTLVGDASQVSKEATISQAVPKGLLWVTTTPQVATSTWKCHGTGPVGSPHNFHLGTSLPASGDTAGCYYQTGVTGALSTYTIGGHVAGSSAVAVMVKIA